MEVFRHRCWLGHGSYGDVQLCEVSPQVAAVLLEAEQREGNCSSEHTTNPVMFALKTLKHAHDDGKVMRLALREVQVLRGLKHPNIAKLQFAFTTPSGRVCMAFEYGGKSTHQLLESRFPSGIPQPLLKRIAYQLLQALRYLHERKVIHRDIKPANVLLDSAGILRLCDFGFARYMVSDTGHPERLTPYVITRWYRAPEVLVGLPYGAAADIWSLGVTLAELATGQPLLPGDSPLDQLRRIVTTTGPLPPLLASRLARHVRETTPEFNLHPLALPTALSAAAVTTAALRRQLAAARPGGYLDLEDSLVALLSACLTPHPEQRPSAAALLQMPYFDDVATSFHGHPLEGFYAAEWDAATAAVAALHTAASYNDAVRTVTPSSGPAGIGADAGARPMLMSHASVPVPESAQRPLAGTSPWMQYQQQHQPPLEKQELQQQQPPPQTQQQEPPHLSRKQSPLLRRQSVPLERWPPQHQPPLQPPQSHLLPQETRPVYQPRPPPPQLTEIQPRLRPMRATAATAVGSLLTHTISGGVDGGSPPDAGSVSANASGGDGCRRPWSTPSSTFGSCMGSSVAASCNMSGPANSEGNVAAASGGGGTSEIRRGRGDDGGNSEGEGGDCWHGRAGVAVVPPSMMIPNAKVPSSLTAAAALSCTRGSEDADPADAAMQAAEHDAVIPDDLDSLADYTTIAAATAAAATATGSIAMINRDGCRVNAQSVAKRSQWGGAPSGIDWSSAAPGKFIKGNAGGVLSREAAIRAAAAVAAFAADAGIAAAAVTAAHSEQPPRRPASNGYVMAPVSGASPALSLSLPPQIMSVAAATEAEVEELSNTSTKGRAAASATKAPATGPPAEVNSGAITIGAWGARAVSGEVDCEVCQARSLPAVIANPVEELLPAATYLSAQLLAPTSASAPTKNSIWPTSTTGYTCPSGSKPPHEVSDSTMTASSDVVSSGGVNPMAHGPMGHFPLHCAAPAKPQQPLQPPPQWLAGFYHDCSSPSSYGNLGASVLPSTEAPTSMMPCAVTTRLDSLTNTTTLHLNWKSAASPDGDDIALAALSAATSVGHTQQLSGGEGEITEITATTVVAVAPEQCAYGCCSSPADSCEPLATLSLQPSQSLQQTRHQAALDWRRPRIGLKVRTGAQPQHQPQPQPQNDAQQSTEGVETRLAPEQQAEGPPERQPQLTQQQSGVDSAFLQYAPTGFSITSDEAPGALIALPTTKTTTATSTVALAATGSINGASVAGTGPTLQSEAMRGSAPLSPTAPHGLPAPLQGPAAVSVRIEHRGGNPAATLHANVATATANSGVMPSAPPWVAPPTQPDRLHKNLRLGSEEATGCSAPGSNMIGVGYGGDGPSNKGGCGRLSEGGSTAGDFDARPFVGCKGIFPGWLRRGKRWFRQTMGAV